MKIRMEMQNHKDSKTVFWAILNKCHSSIMRVREKQKIEMEMEDWALETNKQTKRRDRMMRMVFTDMNINGYGSMCSVTRTRENMLYILIDDVGG